MANTIQLKRSAVASKVPTTSDLALGEIAINTYDGKMYIKKDNGTASVVQIGAPELPDYAGVSNKFLNANGGTLSWAAVSASPAGSDGQIQYNNAGSLAGAGNVIISSGDLALSESTSPTAANTTHTVLLRRSELPYPSVATNAIQNGNVTELYMQPHLGSRDIAWWIPPGNLTTVPGVLGIAAMTAGGTVTARIVATTNVATRARRLGYVSANSVGATCGQYQAQRQWTTADGSGAGGFYCVYRFSISDSSLVTQARMFVGMSNENGAFGTAQQFPMYNYIGVGHDNGESNFKFIYTGSALAPAWSSLSSNFPVAVNTLYELRIYSYTSTVLHMELANLTNGQTATIAITNTTHFPSSTTLLAPRAWRTNNSVSTAVGIDIASLYIEKPY